MDSPLLACNGNIAMLAKGNLGKTCLKLSENYGSSLFLS